MKKQLFFLLLLLSTIVNAQTSTLTIAPTGSVINNTLDLTKYATTISLAGVSNQVDTNQADIATLKSQVAALGTPQPPRPIIGTSYSLVQTDKGAILTFPGTCTLTFSSTLKSDFYCTLIQNKGLITFAGSNFTSVGNLKHVKPNGRIYVLCLAAGSVNLDGDLMK